MKGIYLIIILTAYSLYAQEEPLTNYRLSLLGGIKFENASQINPAAQIELKNNIFPNVDIQFSVGFSKLIESTSIHVDTYRERNIEYVDYYQSHSYDIYEIQYFFIPFSLGLNYNVLDNYYLFGATSYSIVSTDIYAKNSQEGELFESFDMIDEKYREVFIKPIADNSISYSIGFGNLIPITNYLNMHVKYFYEINPDLLNSHNILLGVEFN